MKRALAPLALVALLWPGFASAADLSMIVKGPDGRPVKDAVVTVYPAGGVPKAPIRFDWAYRLEQRNIQFDPFVLIVPVGAEVTFPNFDKVRHHVYSFSPISKFELKLYGREEARAYRFTKPGAAAIGCNIHDQMVAFIKVVDTPYAAKTNAAGEAVIHGLPDGGAQARVWHPYLRAPKGEITQAVTLKGGLTRQSATIQLRAPDAAITEAMMFKSLQTRLTVLYAGLFAIALSLIGCTAYLAAAQNAEHAVRRELDATGTVFDRVWALRSARLADAAGLMSQDFGFRAAVATHDQPTINSALDNLRRRLNLNVAVMVDMDGKVIGQGADLVQPRATDLWYALDSKGDASGVIELDGQSYQMISAPVMAPNLIGWVVFGVRLDRAEMQGLERLSAIPLTANVYNRGQDGAWNGSASTVPVVSAFLDKMLAEKDGDRSDELKGAGGDALALVKPLPGLIPTDKAALLLRYPMAQAMAAYRPLGVIIIITGLLGLAIMALGSWLLARSLTRPIAALGVAARSLERGETAEAVVESEDEIGQLAHAFNGMAREIRDREQRITHLALHDGETGLPNRRSFENRLAETLEHEGDALFVTTLEVDRFSYLRGAIGYQNAGRLMAELGTRLSGLEAGDIVCRLSSAALGLAFRARNEAEARQRLETLLPMLERPVNLSGEIVDAHVSLGLAQAGAHGDTIDLLIQRSSVAVAQARTARRKLAVFDAEAYGDPSGNLSLISDMMAALESGDIDMHYQPKLDLKANRVNGVEALLRWTHPQRGPIRPDLFVGMAEETGHIRPLTDWTLQRVIRDQQTMRAAGHDLYVAVNISGRLLGDETFARAAIDTVLTADARMCFEITETAVIDNPDVALRIIDAFTAAGIEVSIDDYGSGLSSLAYLKQIRAQELKIDKAFILTLDHSQKDALLVKSTVDLAHSLGLKVTAEGVETTASLSLLTAMGCDQAQGYLIARPQALHTMMATVAAANAPAVATAEVSGEIIQIPPRVA